MLQKSRAWNWVALLLMAVLTGCGGAHEVALIGSWKVNTAPGQLPGANSGGANRPGQANALRSMWNTETLELRADQTYTLNLLMRMEGRWTYNSSDGTVSLAMTKVAGTTINRWPDANPAHARSLVCKLSDDHRHLTLQSTPASPGAAGPHPTISTVVFEKQ